MQTSQASELYVELLRERVEKLEFEKKLAQRVDAHHASRERYRERLDRMKTERDEALDRAELAGREASNAWQRLRAAEMEIARLHGSLRQVRDEFETYRCWADTEWMKHEATCPLARRQDPPRDQDY